MSPAPILLPGYEAQPDQDGVEHSKRKLRRAADALQKSLLLASAAGEEATTCSIETVPCKSEKDAWGYRCSCSFQLVAARPSEEDTSDDDGKNARRGSDDGGGCEFVYAMRHKNRPVPLLGTPAFSIAAPRIQRAMELFFHSINGSRSDDGRGEQKRFQFSNLRKYLTSVSFTCSWDERDCVATMHYGGPLPLPPQRQIGQAAEGHDEEEYELWMEEAERVRVGSGLTYLTGRSKGRKLTVPVSVGDGSEQQVVVVIRDVVKIPVPSHAPPSASHDTCTDGSDEQLPITDNRKANDSSEEKVITVYYRKPEGAFQHPNGRAMMQALQWMYHRFVDIASCYDDDNNNNNKKDRGRRPSLLELYCGCGAHTAALARLLGRDVLERIVAVEIDQRLVDACVENCMLNSSRCNGGDDKSPSGDGDFSSSASSVTPVTVIKSDAGELSRLMLMRDKKAGLVPRRSSRAALHGDGRTKIAYVGDEGRPGSSGGGGLSSSSPHEHRQTEGLGLLTMPSSQSLSLLDFDILLVDPPRQGLDQGVCDLATTGGGFKHVIYISCGREALIRDLDRLKHVFEVAACTVLDLFPRTDAVETLVHLVARKGHRSRSHT